MTRFSLITVRQQVASFGVATAVTLAVLSSMTGLAHGYDIQAQQAETSNVAVQTVVIVGKRAA
ncbi:hypothetical protein [Aquabacterium sp.]|uniref:hypothetical protein n=1 Tax=Aquabacterium sp. TaxID=1872578 RepID=UPI002C0326E2|nr:hypothetical protein [Aquabacterium sp.]HSW08000.1 hypothetical protein [Aquabacterium sp.]